jgi:tetratricopeptide (TPR) repeat protein
MPQAEQWLMKAVQQHPSDVRANRALATYYMSRQQPLRAEPYMDKVAKLSIEPQPRLALADFYVATNRHKEAAAVLEGIAADPKTALEARARLATLHHEAGQKAEAHAEIDALIKDNPTSARLLMLKSQLLTTDRRLDEALERAKAAVAIEPRSPVAQYVLGLVYVARKDYELGIRTFNEVLTLRPGSGDAQLQLSRLHLARGDAASAVQFGAESVKNMPGSVPAHLAYAQALIARHDVANTEKEIAWLKRAAPDAAEVDAVDGAARTARGDAAGAQAAFERALAHRPGLLPALSGLIALDLASGHGAAARARLDAALAKNPDDVDLMMLASRAFLALRDWPRAEGLLRKVIDRDPSNLPAYAELGQLFAVQGKLDAARQEFESMAAKDPKSVWAHTMVAMILHSQDRIEETRKRYEQVLVIDPRAAVAANNLAWILAENGESLDRALQLAQIAAERLPDRPEVNDTLGWVYYRKGLAGFAIPSLKLSVQQDPTNPLYSFHLGMAYQQDGKKALSKAALEQALRLKADFPGADEARRTLKSL